MQPVEVLEKDRAGIVATIAKIESTRPALGLKWKESMLIYWYKRLAELTLLYADVEFDLEQVDKLALKLREEAA